MPLLQTRGAASSQGFGMFSKIGDKYWIGLLNGGTSETAYGIATDSIGNVYVCGLSNSSGSEKIQLVKYSPLGVVEWQRNLTPSQFGYAVAVDSSSNVYICGVGSGYQIQIAKYNSSGTIQWQRKLVPGSGNSYGNSIAVDSSANVYICGKSYDTNFGSQGIQIAKYDTSGTIQWQRILQNTFASVIDTGTGTAVDSSGNVYVCGYAAPTEFSAEFQAYLIKYDTSGTIQWQRKLHGAAKDFAYGVAVDSSSNAYVVGESDYLDPNGISRGLIAKYNSSGTIQWQRSLGNSTAASRVQSIAVDSSANLYICGTTSISVDTMQIAKYNSSGTIQWQRNLTNSTRTRGYSIALFSSNIYVCGEAREGSNNDFIIAKLPNDGSLTGTYTVGSSSIIYASTSNTDATSTLTAGTSTLNAATSPQTDSATTATSASTSLTSTVTTL
jgi:hypothetical protein